MRYRLIPTRGMDDESRFVQAEDAHGARQDAQRFHEEIGKPVLVVSHPEGFDGKPTVLFTVGEDEKKGRVR